MQPEKVSHEHVRNAKRHRFGRGPARVFVLGGKGRPLSYEGAAADWWVHYALCSVRRLRILTWLCLHDGEHGARELAEALGLTKRQGETHLMALRWCGLVDGRWLPGGREADTGARVRCQWRWSAAEPGRRYLWRFGWVTGRLVPGIWREDTYYGGADVCPCDALTADADANLLRPTALAVAYMLWTSGPVTCGTLAEVLGISAPLIRDLLGRWDALGWTRSEKRERPWAVGWFAEQREQVWRFTPYGLRAMERHCHALRWAAQHSGYTPPPDDKFFLNENGPHWVHCEFTTEK
jgi:predicted ArsR family transcriptional regulator